MLNHRDGGNPDVELAANIKPAFGKWDSILSRLVATVIYLIIVCFSHQLAFNSFSHRYNQPPTYHVKAGLQGRIVTTLTFQGRWKDHFRPPNLFSLPGVVPIPGGSFFLRNCFKRLRNPYQEIPVYKVFSSEKLQP